MVKSGFNLHPQKICILLTATINPKNVIFVKRNDPIIRENDYIDSLKKWIEKTSYSIVFCENSGYNIDQIIRIAEMYKLREIEILQFNGQNFPAEFGKGYGELLIIKYALQHSNLIKDSDYIIKISGRYFIKNIGKIARGLSYNKDIYIMADLRRNLTWADCRVFAFKPSFFFDYLSKFQGLVNDSNGFYLEHAVVRAVLRAISDGHKWLPLPSKPIVVGYSGTSDTPIRVSKIRWLAGKIAHRLKNYLNRK
ncbi:hypothetical protein ES705_02263 [subsurface metagenome]|nr:hypothetical protein [Clostridia bacterium]